MQATRRCCDTLKGNAPHEKWCWNAAPRKGGTTGHRAGLDSIGDSEDPKYIVLMRCLVLATTYKAVLIEWDEEDIWLPRSVLRKHEFLRRSMVQTFGVEVLENFARKQEII